MDQEGQELKNKPDTFFPHEHEEGRRFTAGFRAAAEQMQRGDADAAADVIRNAFDYVNLLREHIIKEDNVLFPMADQVIDDEKMQLVSKQFMQILDEDNENGSTEKFKALAGKLGQYLNEEISACAEA